MANNINDHIVVYALVDSHVRCIMKEDSIDNLIVYCAVIAVAVVCFFGGRYVGAHQSGYYDLEQRAKTQTQIHAACFDVLHRVWLDNPQYVEDVLFETDEFNRLSDLIADDFEDVFYYWDAEDSITYENSLNREREEAMAVLRYFGNQDADEMPAKAPSDED